MHVDPVEYLPVDDERVVVLGRYRGTARDGGSAVDAAFAHIITTRGDRVAALRQITDTARWQHSADAQAFAGNAVRGGATDRVGRR